MNRLFFLLSDGRQASAIHTIEAEAGTQGTARVIGMTTIIDESSVYPADLSSPFHEDPETVNPS